MTDKLYLDFELSNRFFCIDRSSDFEMIRKIGSGGFGSVYLVSLKDESRRKDSSTEDVKEKDATDVYAMKIIDKVKIRLSQFDLHRGLTNSFGRCLLL